MARYTQDNRRSVLTTVLGKDVLLLKRLSGDEEISGDFEWRVEALSEDSTLNLDDLLGTHATVTTDWDGGTRSYDGIVTSAEWVGYEENGCGYTMTLRPWLHVAGLRRNNRIFHNKTVEDIVQEVLTDYASLGSPHLELRLTEDFPELEYTVQYNESDAHFVQRLFERFGISWYWEHSEGNHTLVATDLASSHPEVPGGSRPFLGTERAHLATEPHFNFWQNGARMTTGAVRLTEFNFKTPTAMQEVEAVSGNQFAHGQIESFDWPGDYLDRGQGNQVVARRVGLEEGQGKRCTAKGNVTSLGVGYRVTLTGDEIPGATGKRYLCVKAHHDLRGQEYGTDGGETVERDYEGEYLMMPDTEPFRPLRRTKLPRVYGPQTAMVVGEGEIDCDEYGRILVRFHWDLHGAHSMRCRVLQHTAAQDYGGMAIPRIGMEAVVEFLEGDPDRPMVTGCVFNGNTDRPYTLPDHKTKHVIRADTHEGEGFNEISFEAQAGQENMHFHAQKDQTMRILNDQSVNISGNRVETVDEDASLKVSGNLLQRIEKNHTVKVGGSGAGLLEKLMPLVQAGGKVLQKGSKKADSGDVVDGFASIVSGVADLPKEISAIMSIGQFASAGGFRKEGGKDQAGKSKALTNLLKAIMPSSGTFSLTVEKFKKETVGLASSEQVGLSKSTTVGNVFTTSIGKLMKTKVGETYDLEAQKKIFTRTKEHTLNATEKVVIGGPGGTIIIDSSGVTIKTKHLKVKSPKVDFTSGAPDQVAALSTDKPFAQDCKGK